MNPVLNRFALSAQPTLCEPYGNGHINETYRVVCDDGAWYILQKINTHVFRDPASLMQNIRLVTNHLSSRAKSRREVLRLVLTNDGTSFETTESGCWRVYEFVRDSVCFERAESKAVFGESAKAFGGFVNLLADFDASKLSETIPHFHDTPARLTALKQAIEADAVGRKKLVSAEIDAALSYERFAHTFAEMQQAGELPLRVTHNDTKINNVLFDAKTRTGLCVIDLDTVMPGLLVNDFGDSIRFGASTATEDEPNLCRVSLDLGLYEAYLMGFLAACGDSLTETEKAMLPVGAKMMTYECGIRFLADYLSGDVYFHINSPEQNLRRARTQLKLVSDMDAKWDDMQTILKGAIQA